MNDPTLAPGLPADLVRRPLVDDDAEAVFDLMRESQLQDEGEVMVDLEDIAGDWQRPSFNLRTDSVGVFEGARLLAYGEVYKGRRAEVYVRPEARGRGIGTALLRWTWDVSRSCGSSLVGQTVPVTLTGAIELFRAHGYRTLWSAWDLELAADAVLSAPALPATVTLRTFAAGVDEVAAYRVVEDAFNEWPDRQQSSFEDWAARTIRRPGFDPWQLLIAEEVTPAGPRVVGVCFVILSGADAWVAELAVERAARGQGLARALLVRAFESARSRGASTGQLSTDSRTGALGLYEHVGMHVTRTYMHYAKEL